MEEKGPKGNSTSFQTREKHESAMLTQHKINL